MLRHIHSIWSAYTFGIATSTVSGRFKIIFRSGVGCQTSITASQISLANSTSVALKLSGEYCSMTSVPLSRGRRSLIHCAPSHGDLHDLVLRLAEDDAALRRRGGVVEVDDDLLRADQRLDGALDQILARLHEHLQPDVVRRAVLLDEPAVEGELGVRRGREADFDFLEAAFHQRLEQLELLADVHRHGERLVAVAQIHAAPARARG